MQPWNIFNDMAVNSIQLKCPYEALKGDLEPGKLSIYESPNGNYWNPVHAVHVFLGFF